jgi:hypothetical protein
MHHPLLGAWAAEGQRKKKAGAVEHLKHSTAPAYSLTGLPNAAGFALYLVIRLFGANNNLGQYPMKLER